MSFRKRTEIAATETVDGRDSYAVTAFADDH